MDPQNKTALARAADGEHDREQLNGKEVDDLELEGWERAQVRRLLWGLELDCRERLKRLAGEFAAAAIDPKASPWKTREWLEAALIKTRDAETRELAQSTASFAERVRQQMQKMLTALIEQRK